MFMIVKIPDGSPYKMDDSIVEYADGKLAAEAARDLSDITGHKWQPRRLKDSGDKHWRDREQARFYDRVYLSMRWESDCTWFYKPESERGNCWDRSCQRYPDHFLHQSVEKGGYVAYTPDDKHGEMDRQVRCRAGAYLKKFFGDVLSSEEIASFATAYAADTEQNELKFAKTPDGIEDVYLRGPDSCMSHSPDFYSSSVHPVRVYGAGDLAIAYIERKGRNGSGDRVTARCVCWPDKKRYGTIYGDHHRLGPLLEKADFKQGNYHAFEGAKLLKIKEGGQVVVPYLDCANGVGDGGDHLILGGDDYTAESTTGLSGEDERVQCASCGERLNDDDIVQVYYAPGESESHCSECADDRSVYCEGEEINVLRGEATALGNDTGEFMSNWYYRRRGRDCDHCEGSFHCDDVDTVDTRDGEQQWCPHCRNNDAATCDSTGDLYAADALVTTTEGSIVGFNTVAGIGVEEFQKQSA